jgi:histidyl-tRNA synthetase
MVINISPYVLVASVAPEQIANALQVAKELRIVRIPTLTDTRVIRLKKKIDYAEQQGCRFIIMLGENEVKKHTVNLRDLKEHTSCELDEDDAIELIMTFYKGCQT